MREEDTAFFCEFKGLFSYISSYLPLWSGTEGQKAIEPAPAFSRGAPDGRKAWERMRAFAQRRNALKDFAAVLLDFAASSL